MLTLVFWVLRILCSCFSISCCALDFWPKWVSASNPRLTISGFWMFSGFSKSCRRVRSCRAFPGVCISAKVDETCTARVGIEGKVVSSNVELDSRLASTFSASTSLGLLMPCFKRTLRWLKGWIPVASNAALMFAAVKTFSRQLCKMGKKSDLVI